MMQRDAVFGTARGRLRPARISAEMEILIAVLLSVILVLGVSFLGWRLA